MSETLIVALIAGSVTLVVAFINTFVSESYKRFRDGATVAASLAGELAAYEDAWPMLSDFLSSVVSATEAKGLVQNRSDMLDCGFKRCETGSRMKCSKIGA